MYYHSAAQLMEFGAGVLWDLNGVGDVQMDAENVSRDMGSHRFSGDGGVRIYCGKAIIEGRSITVDFFMSDYRIDSVQ